MPTELKRFITHREFQNISELSVPSKLNFKKRRNSFIYKGIFFIMDTMVIEDLTFSILVIQGFQNESIIEIPQLIKQNIVKDAKGSFTRRADRGPVGNTHQARRTDPHGHQGQTRAVQRRLKPTLSFTISSEDNR